MFMGKAKRYGYIFIWHIGDHSPLHIHVYKNGMLVCRWQLAEKMELSGKATAKIKKAMKELEQEGAFKTLRRRK